MKLLYSYKKNIHSQNEKRLTTHDVKIFTPTIPKLILPGEIWDLKKILTRLFFQIISKGKAKIYYISDGDKIKHTSYVVPKCFKFTFLGESDYEIGPCYTYSQYRGQGLYPMVLRSICDSLGNIGTTFFMIVDDSNISSVRGIEKAGFVICGEIVVTKYTKIYKLK